MVSSTVHLVLSTTPFLILFLYFTYSAYNRPNIILSRDDDVEVPSLIPLTDMLLIILGNLLLWSFLFVYLAFFVRRRRRLMKSYLRGLPDHQFQVTAKNDLPMPSKSTSEKAMATTNTTTGYVYYHQPKTWLGRLCNSFTYTDKAYLVYRHPDGSGMFVQKHIRTYHPFHRENVSVLLLSGEPLSGLPKDDVERDVGSFTRYVRSQFTLNKAFSRKHDYHIESYILFFIYHIC